MTELIVIRHGLTAWNEQGRFQGALDVPLADEGHQQAARVARRLAGAGETRGKVAAIYSSDLSRAWQTATPIGQALQCDVRPEPALRERSYGDFQGLTGVEIAARHPEAWQRWRERQPDFALPGGGESLDDIYKRVGRALSHIVEQHPGESVVIVTHGGVLDCVYRIATGLPLNAPRQHDLLNASLNVVDWQDGRYQLRRWADVAHLDSSSDDR